MTPIEERFMDAALGSMDRVVCIEDVKGPYDVFLKAYRAEAEWVRNRQPAILMAAQVPYAGCRADFFLELYEPTNAPPARLFVECDGHEFHERTKEQAARDRKRDRMFQLYAPVLRFTGSELYRHADECWREACNALSEMRQDNRDAYRKARVDALLDVMCEDDGVSELACSVAVDVLLIAHNCKVDRDYLMHLGVTEDSFPVIAKELAPYVRTSIDTEGRFVFRPHRKWVRS